MTELRCLSLHQPWASLIAVGVKRIETRSWPTKHRGRIGIASTVKKPVQGEDVGDWWADYDVERWIIVHDYKPGGHWLEHDAPLGAIVATANLVDCVPILEFAPGHDPLSPHVCVDKRADSDALIYPGSIEAVAGDDITDQLPYGVFSPGRWAWLLEDVKPTTERCPACWGTPGELPARCCWTCQSHHRTAPLPVKGRQGLWKWQP